MNKGQSLFEVVIALAIISLIIVGVVILGTTSIRNSSYARDKTLATKYVQEATEWLRGQRDAGWDAFLSNVNLCPVRSDNQGQPYINHCFSGGSFSWSKCDCSSDDLVVNTFTRQTAFYCRIISQSNSNPSPVSCSTAGVNEVQADIGVSWTDSQGMHEVISATTYSNWKVQ